MSQPRSFLPLMLGLLAVGCTKNGPPPEAPPPPVAAPIDPIPEGFFTLTPQLTVENVDEAIEFYVSVFSAQTLRTVPDLDGTTTHAEVRIGDSIVLIDEPGEDPARVTPHAVGGTPATLVLYLPDADEVYLAAVEAGAEPWVPIEERFWGDRYGEFIDPFGHRWALTTHVVDLDDDELAQRAELAGKKSRRKKSRAPKWRSIPGRPAQSPTPERYHTVTLALTVEDVEAAVEFYEQAFDAERREVRFGEPHGVLMAEELTIGNSVLMLGNEHASLQRTSAVTLGDSPVTVQMYVEDVDAAFAQANAAANGTFGGPVTDEQRGDRHGSLVDRAGIVWTVATRVAEVAFGPIARRL